MSWAQSFAGAGYVQGSYAHTDLGQQEVQKPLPGFRLEKHGCFSVFIHVSLSFRLRATGLGTGASTAALIATDGHGHEHVELLCSKALAHGKCDV
jgi:hypothetical protein